MTIKEADGSEQHMTVPFASLPVLQREGRLKYALTSGQYRTYDHSVEKKVFSQGSLIYGLPAGFTLYGGGQFAGPYQSLALGVGKTWVSSAPCRWTRLRPGRNRNISRKATASRGACATAKTS